MTRRPAHGRSWPVRPSEADSWFGPEVEDEVEVSLIEPTGPPRPGSAESVLSMDWDPDRGFVDVSIYAVPSADRRQIREALLTEVLPQVRLLVAQWRESGDGWRMLRHEVAWEWRGGRLDRCGEW